MKTILQKLFGFLLLSVVVLSCNDVLTEQEPHTDQCLIRISLSEQEDSSLPAARTIQPDSIQTGELSYRLTAQKGTATITRDWESQGAMTSDTTLLLDVGEWTFTLDAYKAGREDAALSATITQTIASGAGNQLVFTLSTTESGAGSLCMALIVGTTGSQGESVTPFSSVTATLCDTTGTPLWNDETRALREDLASSADWTSYDADTNGPLTQSWTTTDFSAEDFDGTVTYEVTDGVPCGTYMLWYTVTTTGGVTSSFPVVAQVVPGNNSSGSFDISSSASGSAAVSFYKVFYADGVEDEEIPVPEDTSLYRPGIDSVTVRFAVSEQPVARTGYTFTGWKWETQQGTTIFSSSGTATFTMPADNVTLVAQWTPNSDTAYTVRHWKQKLNAAGTAAAASGEEGATDKTITEPTEPETAPTCVDYTLEETVGATGTTAAQTSAVAQSYTGFTVQPITNKTIAADGSTIVDVFYDRYERTITYVDNVEGEDIVMPQDVHTCYGATVLLTFSGVTRENYDFTGWTTSSTSTSAMYADREGNRTVPMSVDSITLYAVWTLSVFTVTFDGNGGHVPITNAESYTQTYERNTNGVYTNNLNPNQFTREGYVFKGWASTSTAVYTTNPETNGVEYPDGNEYTAQGNKTFYAVWNPIVSYKVRHFMQNVVGNDYTEVGSDGSVLTSEDDVETLTGEIGASTAAEAKTFTGFTALSFDQTTIASSGTVIRIYYKRNLHTVTYSNGLAATEHDDTITLPFDGTNDEETGEPMYTQYRYGATVTVRFGATRQGYTFIQWHGTITTGTSYFNQPNRTTFVMGDTDVVLNAQWEANTDTAYTVRHWKQKLNAAGTVAAGTNTSTDYELQPTEAKTGTTARDTVAIAKTAATDSDYTGFTAQPFDQQPIAADGSTIVDIFYDRDVYAVTYSDGVSTQEIAVPEGTSACYGATVTVDFTNMDTVGLRHGYSFSGWASSVSDAIYTAPSATTFTMGASPVVLTAVWTRNEIGDGGISVIPPAYSDVNLNLDYTPPTDGNSVTFTAASGYASYVWLVDGVITSFGDGVTNSENGTVTYTWDCSGEADKYCITLIVTDNNGKTYSATTYVQIRK